MRAFKEIGPLSKCISMEDILCVVILFQSLKEISLIGDSIIQDDFLLLIIECISMKSYFKNKVILFLCLLKIAELVNWLSDIFIKF